MIKEFWMLHFGLLFPAPFIPRRSNIHITKSFCSYKFGYNYENKILVLGLIFYSLILNIAISYPGPLSQLWCGFKHLLNWINKTLSFSKMFMLKTGHISRRRELQKLGRNLAAIPNRSQSFFIQFPFKIDSFFQTQLAISKTINIFYCFHHYPSGEAGVAS